MTHKHFPKVMLFLSACSLDLAITNAINETGAMQVACVLMTMLTGFVSALCIGAIASESKRSNP